MTKEELQKLPLFDPLTHPVWTLRAAFYSALDDYYKAIRDQTDVELLQLYNGTWERLDRDRTNDPLPPNCTPETSLTKSFGIMQGNWAMSQKRSILPIDPLTQARDRVSVVWPATLRMAATIEGYVDDGEQINGLLV